MRTSARLRRALCAALASASALACPLAAAGEKRILALRSGGLPLYDEAVNGFVGELKARGVAFRMEDRIIPPDEAGIERFMADLLRDPPDFVITVGTLAARTVREKGRGLPFTYTMIVDPASLGIATGGAVMEVLPSAQWDFIRTHFPALKRVGFICSHTRNRETVRLLQQDKPSDILMVKVSADTPEEMSKAILRLSQETDALLMVSDALLYSPQTAAQIILQTIQNGLPLIAVSPSFVRAGALAAVYPDYKDNGVLAAGVAARYFAGEPLSSIPVQWPTRTHFAVNLVVAQRLGVKVNNKTMEAAQEVVR